MGDHICGKAPLSPKAQPASMNDPFTIRQMNASGQRPTAVPPPPQQSQPADIPKMLVRAPTVTSSPMAAPKPIKTAPPRINPDAANRPFLAPRPPRSQSPMSPAISVRSGSSNSSRPSYQRSMTSPAPRLFNPRPPSPELSSNLDCAFPSFPTSSSTGSRPGTSNGRKTPTPSERAPSRGGSRQDSRLNAEREPFNHAPRSPLSSGEDGTMPRMGGVAGSPSGGAGQRRPSVHDRASQQPTPLDRRRPSLSSIKMSHEPLPIPTEPIPRPSTSHINRSQIPINTPTANSIPVEITPAQKVPPARPDRSAHDGLSASFLNQLSAEPVVEMPSTFSPSQPPVPLRSTDRSRTFPVRQESSDDPSPSQVLQRTATEPEVRGRQRRPTLTTGPSSEPSSIPQAQTRARSQSRSGPRIDHRLHDAPPVPRPVQLHKQENMHAPSDSGSSIASSRSHGNSNSTGGPSPVESAASSVDAFSPLSYEPGQYGSDERMRVTGLNLKTQQKPGMRAEQPVRQSPPQILARLSPPQQPAQLVQPAPTVPAMMGPQVESPMDPGFPNGRTWPAQQESWRELPTPQQRPTLPRTNTTPNPVQRPASPSTLRAVPQLPVPKPSPGNYDPYRPASPQPTTRARSKSNAAPQYKPYNTGTFLRPHSPQPVPPPPPIPHGVPTGQPPARRGTSARPLCRGCGMVIEGRSVKAADGRLTGRWHKACFTCRTCEQPFTTADFYVINDHPYCEHHYHEKNGSLCHGCHRGIEGQYLESTSSSTSGSTERKFHPRCFTCHDCQRVLSDDYFEICGKVYCERHALAAMRGQARMAGPGLNPPGRKALTAERRTTKLMMM